MANKSAIEIKVAMLRAKPRITQAQIARELQLTRAAVNQVINGRGISKRVSEYIEKKLRGRA